MYFECSVKKLPWTSLENKAGSCRFEANVGSSLLIIVCLLSPKDPRLYCELILSTGCFRHGFVLCIS